MCYYFVSTILVYSFRVEEQKRNEKGEQAKTSTSYLFILLQLDLCVVCERLLHTLNVVRVEPKCKFSKTPYSSHGAIYIALIIFLKLLFWGGKLKPADSENNPFGHSVQIQLKIAPSKFQFKKKNNRNYLLHIGFGFGFQFLVMTENFHWPNQWVHHIKYDCSDVHVYVSGRTNERVSECICVILYGNQ